MVATKDQERKALEQIKKIVADLGEDSYIATAFDGVWKIAEENIENDFGKSCAWYIDRCFELKEKNAHIAEQLVAKERNLSAEVTELEAELSRKERIISEQEIHFQELEKSYETAIAVNEKHDQDNVKLNNNIELLKLEITKLKAKLFDLMFQGD